MTKPTESPAAAIQKYESLVFGSSEPCGFSETRETIECMVEFANAGGLRERGNSAYVCEHFYTRFCAAFTGYLANPDTKVTLSQLEYFCRRKQVLAYCFAASGFRNMHHLVHVIARYDGDELKIPADRAPLLLAVIDLDALTPEMIDMASRQPPELLVKFVLGWLGQRAVLTEAAEANRSRILQMGKLIETAAIKDGDILSLVNVWMYCSYAESSEKHEIKRSLNALLLKRMTEAGIAVRPTTHVKKMRPKMLVIHERFSTEHAMFRCYASSIGGLAKNFELVALVEAMQIGAEGEALFEGVIKLEEVPPVSELVTLIQKLAPDVIYYPSIGMSHWVIMLAGQRLAPIQIMSHGHPATSMWQTIDYAYVSDLKGDIESIHSEKLLVGSNTVGFSSHRNLPSKLPALQSPSDREVRIAVNSKVMKLSHRLMSVCKRIADNARYPVRFSFFPGERFILYDGLVAAIQRELPEAAVMPYMDYSSFIQELAKCDLALSAFPFGNTNSTVDASLLGIPTVARLGEEPSAQTDQLVLETAGLAEWLVCDTDDSYYATALSLVNDPALRREALNGLSREQIRRNLFDKNAGKEQNPFADVMWAVYNQHQSLQASQKQSFHYTELLSQT